MPIYEYECSKCGRIDEVLQRFSDKPMDRCKHCSGKLHKLISQSTFHLKGSGWYVTDYASKSKSSSEPSRSSGKLGGASDSAEKTKMETKSSTESSAKSDSQKSKE